MLLEKDDYFVIDDPPQEIINKLGAKITILSDFDGLVFQALEVCGDFVAARIIERDSSENLEKFLVISLNAKRHTIYPVTQKYAESIMKSRSNISKSKSTIMDDFAKIMYDLEDNEGDSDEFTTDFPDTDGP
jgi:hypothetical protein